MKPTQVVSYFGVFLALCLRASFGVAQTLSITHPSNQVGAPLSSPLSERSMQLSVDPSGVDAASNSYKDSVRLYSWSSPAEVHSRVDSSVNHVPIGDVGYSPSMRSIGMNVSASWRAGAVPVEPILHDSPKSTHSGRAKIESDSRGLLRSAVAHSVLKSPRLPVAFKDASTSRSRSPIASSRAQVKPVGLKTRVGIPADPENATGVETRDLPIDIAIVDAFDPSTEIREKLLNGTWKTGKSTATHFRSSSRLGPRSWRLKSRGGMGQKNNLGDKPELSRDAMSDSH